MAKAIGTLGTVPTITVGGRVFTDVDNLKILMAEASISPASYATFKDLSTGIAYVAPSGKTFKIMAIANAVQVGGNNASIIELGYGDNNVGFESATPPTSKFDYMTSSNATLIPNVTPGERREMALPNLLIPTGKYPYVAMNNGASSATCFVYGYEV